MKQLDKLEASYAAKPAWANIGYVTKPGASLLDMSLTHRTEGIPLFPAVDLAWGAGVPMYAPEAVYGRHEGYQRQPLAKRSISHRRVGHALLVRASRP